MQDHLGIALAPENGRFTLSIGTFVDSSIPVYLDMDDLLGKHAAIVGTTGCGKSYTVAQLLQEVVANYPGTNIIVFDLHGEYRNCFPSSNYIRADQLSLPAWLHSFDNLFDLCADLSNQFNIHNQRWAFREGIFKLKQRYCEETLNDSTLSNNIDLDAPIPFNFQHLLNYLKNLNNVTKDSNDNPAYATTNGNHDLFKGIGVFVVSQRPSELSETLLSQCNTFLCMRLANSVDKNHILSLLPDSMSNMVDILPILPRGHVLAVGQATKMPIRIAISKINIDNNKPDSDDPPFGKKWKEDIGKRIIPDSPILGLFVS